MRITAQLKNSRGRNEVLLATDNDRHTISIPPKESGHGSKANGGELLFLALATCYCNDLYREAAKRGIQLATVEVEVTGEFGGVGEPARNVTYRAKVEARASERDIRDLMTHTDQVAEIHNSLRLGTKVSLAQVEVRSTTEA